MKTLLSLFTVSVCLLTSWGAFAAGETARYALIIGANDGGSDRVRLRYAVKDARSVASVLSQLGGIPSSRQIMVLDPKVPDLEKALQGLSKRLASERPKVARTEVLVYYSGHSDEQGLLLQGKRLTYKNLRTRLKALPTDVRVVILDSCASGAMTRDKGGRRVPAFLKDQAVQVTGQAILTSSSADEVAQESDRIRGSFFTHSFIAGLRGAADVTGDRRVTLNEAYQFAFRETLERTENTRGGAQHPAYDIQLSGHGDLVLTDLNQTNARLQLSKPLGGKVAVRDSQGNLVIELHKVPGRALDLAMPADTYEVRLQRSDKRVFQTQVQIRRGARVSLGMSSFSPMQVVATTSRGGVTHSTETLHASEDVLYAGVDLFPFAGVSSVYPWRPRFLSLNIGGGISGGLRGFELGGGANIDLGSVRGLQIAGGFNLATEGLLGVQVAAVNTTIQGIRGAQIGGVNVGVGELRGGQAGGVNINLANSGGLQLGGVNFTSGKFWGVQGGGVNLAGPTKGTQVGGVNLAMGEVRGLQIGGINLAGPTFGSQIGGINIGVGHVQGTQIGAINIAGSSEASIGAINVFWNGRTQMDAWTSEALSVHAGVRHGSGAIYNIYSVGAKPIGGKQIFSMGLGLGFHKQLTSLFDFDADAIAHSLHNTTGGIIPLGNMYKARAMFSFNPTPWFSVYAGPTVNVMVSDCDTVCGEYAPFGSFEATNPDSALRVLLWPGMVLGARLF